MSVMLNFGEFIQSVSPSYKAYTLLIFINNLLYGLSHSILAPALVEYVHIYETTLDVIAFHQVIYVCGCLMGSFRKLLHTHHESKH